MFSIELVVIWIGCAILCGYIATQKNLNVFNWSMLGLFFGLFTVIAIVFAKEQSASIEDNELMCSKCEHDVTEQDKFCSNCGDKLE